MKNLFLPSSLAVLLLTLTLHLRAEVVMTDPLGFNKVTCLTDSDTIVAVPFRPEGSVNTQLSGDPTVNGDSATLTLSLNSLDPALNTNYVKFSSGTRDGRWYDITTNTSNSVTIDLNGDNLTGVTSGDSVVIAKYWTLDTLFPPNQATTAWTEDGGEQIPNGHAIVESPGARAFERRTEVLLPDLAGLGINRGISGIYIIHDNQWKILENDVNPAGDVILYPDITLTIRHPDDVDHPTVFRNAGEVLVDSFTIPLSTQSDGDRDNHIGLLRPVDVTLTKLNLWESGAFVQSLGDRAFERRDILLIFDNSLQSINKSIDITYYHDGNSWLTTEDNGDTNRDDDIIPAGSGFIIRKHQTDAGETAFWQNIPSY